MIGANTHTHNHLGRIQLHLIGRPPALPPYYDITPIGWRRSTCAAPAPARLGSAPLLPGAEHSNSGLSAPTPGELRARPPANHLFSAPLGPICARPPASPTVRLPPTELAARRLLSDSAIGRSCERGAHSSAVRFARAAAGAHVNATLCSSSLTISRPLEREIGAALGRQFARLAGGAITAAACYCATAAAAAVAKKAPLPPPVVRRSKVARGEFESAGWNGCDRGRGGGGGFERGVACATGAQSGSN